MKSIGSESVNIKLTGLVGILFDKFVDMSADERPPEQKLYLNDKNELVMPSENIYSFLFGGDSGCARRFEAKKWKDYVRNGMSYVTVNPEYIPFTRNGKPIKFTKFVEGYDKNAKIMVMHHKAIVKKGSLSIPSPKSRPMLETPWELEYEINVFENSLIDIAKIKNWHVRGGIEVALGTYRPRFGRFTAEFK
jgi:hypothetical protein